MLTHAPTLAVWLALAGLHLTLGAPGVFAQQPAGTEPAPVSVERASGSFDVPGGDGYPEKRIRVLYHRPSGFDRRSPVVMVTPGAGRNGD